MNVARLAKIKKLAESGKAGEREAAQRILADLIRKHDVDPSILRDDPVSEYCFVYRTKYERLILTQLIHKVLNVDSFPYTKGRGRLLVACTQYQADMILVLFATYRRELASELLRTARAFIQANRIFSDAPPTMDKLTRAQLSELMEVLKRANSMSPVSLPAGYIGSGKGSKL